MTLTQFIERYNGVGNVGTTTENTGECVGIIQKWLKNIAPDAPYTWGHAKDLLINADRNSYEVIENTPDAVPEAGDVIVWKQGFNGTFGHTAIVVKGNVATFEVFEQNNPLNSPCRLHTYPNYAYVEGWLRNSAKSAQPITQELTDQTIIPAVLLGQSLPLEIQQIRGLLGDFRRCREELAIIREVLNTVEEDKEDLVGQLKGSMQALENEMNLNVKLANKLKECESKPHSTPETPDEHTSYDTGADVLVGLIKSFTATIKRILSK